MRRCIDVPGLNGEMSGLIFIFRIVPVSHVQCSSILQGYPFFKFAERHHSLESFDFLAVLV